MGPGVPGLRSPPGQQGAPDPTIVEGMGYRQEPVVVL